LQSDKIGGCHEGTGLEFGRRCKLHCSKRGL
jgi:hypothetical protein